MLDPHQALQGKTELFQKKVTKKGPKNRVRLDHSHSEISQFFHEFPGFPKIQVEMPRAGKGGGAGAYALRKNHSYLLTDVQTDTSSWKPGVAEKEAPSAQLLITTSSNYNVIN